MNDEAVQERARERLLSAEIAEVLQVELAVIDAVERAPWRHHGRSLAAAVVLLGIVIAGGVAWLREHDSRLAQQPQDAPSLRDWLGRQPQGTEIEQLPLVDIESLLVPMTLPGEGPIRGLAWQDGLVWLARGETLLACQPAPTKIVRQRALPTGLRGLAADRRFLYVLERDAVEVFDPIALQSVRRLPLPEHEADGPPRAICCRGDQICVAFGRRLVAIDNRTAEAQELPHGPTGLLWLASDGEQLWGGDERRIVKLAGDGGASTIASLRLPMSVQRGAAAFAGDRLLCAFDLDDNGGVRRHVAGYLPLDRVMEMPVDCLSVKIYRHDKGLKYEVGPKPLSDLGVVKMELQRIAQDPRSMIPGPAGKRVLMPVALEAYPGVRIGDLAAAWDIVTAIGFDRVYCAQADAARRRERQPKPVERGR